MKVIGVGSPDDVRVRFTGCELDVLVDVLRDLRAKAAREAAETYATTSPQDTRPIDDCHDRLRGLEGLLMQLIWGEVCQVGSGGRAAVDLGSAVVRGAGGGRCGEGASG